MENFEFNLLRCQFHFDHFMAIFEQNIFERISHTEMQEREDMEKFALSKCLAERSRCVSVYHTKVSVGVNECHLEKKCTLMTQFSSAFEQSCNFVQKLSFI